MTMKKEIKPKRKYSTPKIVESEIENQILCYLESQWVSVEKVASEGYYNANKGFYQKRKSRYSRSGTADIHGTIPPYGRWLFIEVKTPTDIHFFDRPPHELAERLVSAQYDRWVDPKKYIHAVEQWAYILEKIQAGAIAFYADSTDTVIAKLRAFWVEVS
jgi:hypothetical protein